MTDSIFVPKDSDFTIEIQPVVPPRWEKFTEEVSAKVFGQERAVRKAVRLLLVFEAGLNHPQAPMRPLLFVGPSGSGKTLLAEVLAEKWLGVPEEGGVGPFIKLDGENFTQSHEGASISGAPPGYIGYNDENVLENIGVFDREKRMKAVDEALKAWVAGKKREFQSIPAVVNPVLKEIHREIYDKYERMMSPFRSVLLVDELEKMHAKIQKRFLGVLDTGKLVTHRGVIDARGCLIIFTSNIGTDRIARYLDNNPIGFKIPSASKDYKRTNDEIYRIVKSEVGKSLAPELYSRIGHDGIVVFHTLSAEDYLKIIKAEISMVQNILTGKTGGGALLIRVTEAFEKFVLDQADTSKEGGRQIRPLVTKYLREPLAVAILGKKLRSGDEILFDVAVAENGSREVKLMRSPRPKNVKMPIFEMPYESVGDLVDSAIGDIEKRFDHFIEMYVGKKRRKNPPNTAVFGGF